MNKHLLVYALVGLLLGSPALTGAAPNKVWLIPGTALKFADSAQTPTRNLTLTALAAGAGRVSAQYDKNALASASGAMPHLWRWGCTVQLTGTNVVGDVIEVYVATSDGTIVQGNIGTADAALATDKRKNLLFAGILVVDQTTTNTSMMGSGYVEIRERYFSLALWNATGLPFKTDTAVHTCYMTPQSLEIQSAIPLDMDKHPPVSPLALA